MPPTGRGKAGNLPQELTSFVGRKTELTEARHLLSESRLVTLTGPGGVGKTRLALRMASITRRAFADGVWLVEFDQLQDPALVAHTVADSLGLRERAGRPLLQTLEEHLAERRVLLVLDNCEHLVDAVAKLADALLRASPRLHILATSREPLGVRGEVALPISPLPVPAHETSALRDLSSFDSISLFTERATAALPEFGITEDNRADVAQICLRLEGLPLAIELAAVRLRALSTEQILHRLSDRYRLLTAGPRSAPTRQQTLHACIGWSYDLCTSAEQLLWARLTVFAGVVELDAAEGVCAGDGLAAEDILDLVASLVDKSILVRAPDDVATRYRMLETIREFGAERLAETGQEAELRRRHRDWYERLVRDAEADLISPRQVDWQARLHREIPNTRAALTFGLTEPGEADVSVRMATALHAYWTRGRLSEGRQWLRRALDHQTASRTVSSAKALYAAAMLAGFQGDVPGATTLVEELHDVAERLDDADSRALATQAAANVAVFRSDLAAAVACYEAVLDHHRAEGNLPRLLEALIGLAFASGLRGDTARSISCHEEMQAITEPRGEAWYRSYSLYDFGFVMWRQGDTRRAAELIEQSLRLKRLVDDPLSTAFCLEALAWIATGEHRFQRAAVLLGAAESLSQAVGTPTATFPDLLAYHERYVQQTRDHLGEEAFEAAYRTGLGLTFADAIAYALDEQAEETPPTRASTPLTRRERQVAELVAQGLSNREIATRLVIAQRTAEGHVERILVKLGLSSRMKVAAWLAEHS